MPGSIATETINVSRHDQSNRENERNPDELVEIMGIDQGQSSSVETVLKALDESTKINEEPFCRNQNNGVFKSLFDDSGASSDSGYRVEMDEKSMWQITRQMMQATDRPRTETEPPELSSMALKRRLTADRYLPANILLTTSGMLSGSSLLTRNFEGLRAVEDVLKPPVVCWLLTVLRRWF